MTIGPYRTSQSLTRRQALVALLLPGCASLAGGGAGPGQDLPSGAADPCQGADELLQGELPIPDLCHPDCVLPD